MQRLYPRNYEAANTKRSCRDWIPETCSRTQMIRPNSYKKSVKYSYLLPSSP